MKIPSASYRIQFNSEFGFSDAINVVDYLSDLGITAVYASPVFTAIHGSMHGYDVVDPNSINPELGGEAEFDRLSSYVREKGMQWIQDIVPNHVSYSGDNYIIADIMENGENSRYFGFPDINWDHPYIRGRILAPFLGKQYGRTLENGEIKLNYSRSGFSINYYEHVFSLKVETYYDILSRDLKGLGRRISRQHPDYLKLLGLLHILRNLPSRDQIEERYEQINIVKIMLWELYEQNEEIREYIDSTVTVFNGQTDNNESYKLLDELLGQQNFRLSFWKVATEEINYRRFFNINELICLRTQNTDVFKHTHKLILDLLGNDSVSGLRIDHIDGLYDPEEYLRNLRENVDDKYIVVEKILEFGEQLPENWKVQGTTGYEFLNILNGLFCMRENRDKFSRIYRAFTANNVNYSDLLYEKKKMIIEKHLMGDVDNLAHHLKSISAKDRHGSDITLNGLKRTLVEIASLFPIYRTYVNSRHMSDQDRHYIVKALNDSRMRNPELVNEINYLGKFLLFEFFDYISEDEKSGWVDFVMKFQQLTGPLMAKGFEDTTLYIYNRLISLNEVGGNPDSFGVPVNEFHIFNSIRAEQYPHTINTTSTHDTKRGEDTRARINVLSEMPDEWNSRLRYWSRENKKKKTKIMGRNAPSKNDEYFLYQSMIGGMPSESDEFDEFKSRLKEYVVKAVREAKVHTAWLEPDIEYENAFLSFIDSIMEPSDDNEFLNDFNRFQYTVAFYGVFNSLSQTLVKITSPGVPDFYQGTEFWDLTFVDPDNRRPVDYEKRRKLLEVLKTHEPGPEGDPLIRGMLDNLNDGRIKTYILYRALNFRNNNIELFQNGSYIPLETTGSFGSHLIAFARCDDNIHVVTVVPRFLSRIVDPGEAPLGNDVWGESGVILPEKAVGKFRNVLTGEILETSGNALKAGEILKSFPVALLHGGK